MLTALLSLCRNTWKSAQDRHYLPTLRKNNRRKYHFRCNRMKNYGGPGRVRTDDLFHAI